MVGRLFEDYLPSRRLPLVSNEKGCLEGRMPRKVCKEDFTRPPAVCRRSARKGEDLLEGSLCGLVGNEAAEVAEDW